MRLMRSHNKLTVLLKSLNAVSPNIVKAAKAANTDDIRILGDGRHQAARLLSRHAEVLLHD